MAKQKFILLSTQRTGSTAFRLLLNSHPDIRCHDEVFLKESGAKDAISQFVAKHPKYHSKYRWMDYHGNSRLIKLLLYRKMQFHNSLVHANNGFVTRLLSEFMDDLFNNPKHSAPWTKIESWEEYVPNVNFEIEKCIGFNIMYYELQNNFLMNYLKQKEVKIIHLIRKNKLERIISRKLAKARNSWHTEDKVVDDRIEINPSFLVENINNQLIEDRKWERCYSGDNYLKVYYEDFRDKAAESANPVLEFLGIPRADLSTPLKKISGSPRDVLSNYDEIKATLKAAGMEYYLGE